MAEILLDTLVHFLIISPYLNASVSIGSIARAPALCYGYVSMSHVVPSHSSGLTPVKLFPEYGFMCNLFMNVCM